MPALTVTVWTDADALAEAVAARLVTHLVRVQADRGHASVALTGGGVGIAVLGAIARSASRDSVDFSALHVWWSDERFVAVDDPRRNERQAREALLDHVALDPAKVHPMPSAPDEDADVHEAASAYAALLAEHADIEAHAPVPRIDVMLLGLGPDGHVASLFPHQPALYDTRTVVGVEAAPKPPPQRITMTLPTIQTADEVWVVAAGAEKGPAAELALGGAGPMAVPAVAAQGRHATCWLLDRAAATGLPPGLARPASP
jgi:6-phosphogluconolactonase